MPALQITVSCGYDAMGRKRTETATFTPEPGMAPSDKARHGKAFAGLLKRYFS